MTTTPMTNDTPGLLMVWTDIPAEVEPEFNEWYNREHMPDRINKVPGFTRARRFISLSGAPRHLALYETRSADIFRSAPYIAINKTPDPTSRRFIPLFRNTIKGICDSIARVGQGEGAMLALLPVSVTMDREDEFAAWARDSMLPDIVSSTGVIAATYARRNRTIQEIAAASYTRAGDRYVYGLIAVECADERGLAKASASLAPDVLKQHGASVMFVDGICTFRNLYTVHA